MRTPYTNTEDHAVYVGGQLIPAGETRQVELHTALDAPADDEPVDPLAALKKVMAGKVVEIVPALQGLSDEDLDAAPALELAEAKPRSTLVQAIELARLERIDQRKQEAEAAEKAAVEVAEAAEKAAVEAAEKADAGEDGQEGAADAAAEGATDTAQG